MEEMQLSDIDENQVKENTPSTGEMEDTTYVETPINPEEQMQN